MQSLLFWLIAFAMGVMTSIYLSMNGVVARYVGSALLTNIQFFNSYLWVSNARLMPIFTM